MENVDGRVAASMNQLGLRHAVMAAYPKEKTTDIPEHSFLSPASYWDERARGLGATLSVPLSSSAEENAMCHEDDRYRGEDITVHEFAHSLMNLGLSQVFDSFSSELTSLYNAAKSSGNYGDHYAMTCLLYTSAAADE